MGRNITSKNIKVTTARGGCDFEESVKECFKLYLQKEISLPDSYNTNCIPIPAATPIK